MVECPEELKKGLSRIIQDALDSQTKLVEQKFAPLLAAVGELVDLEQNNKIPFVSKELNNNIDRIIDEYKKLK